MNAIEAVEEGGTILIHGRYKKDLKKVVFHVVDNGLAFDVDKDFSDLTDPFFTDKEKDHAGVGLFQAQKVVYKYDGKLRFEANQPKGLDVCFELPINISIVEKKSENEESDIDLREDHILPFVMMRDIVFNARESELLKENEVEVTV